MKLYRQNIAVLVYATALLLLNVGVGIAFLISWDAEYSVRWVGALSGWAAAVVGGVTIIVLLHQIRSQSREARIIGEEAKHLFLEEAEPILKGINQVWKHAEDVKNAGNLHPNFKDYIINLKMDVKLINEWIEHMDWNKYCAHMRPIDEQRFTALAGWLDTATKPFTFSYYDEDDDAEKRYDLDGEAYLNALCLAFNQVRKVTHPVDPVLFQCFKNRAGKFDEVKLDALLAYGREKERERLARRYPVDEANPY